MRCISLTLLWVELAEQTYDYDDQLSLILGRLANCALHCLRSVEITVNRNWWMKRNQIWKNHQASTRSPKHITWWWSGLVAWTSTSKTACSMPVHGTTSCFVLIQRNRHRMPQEHFLCLSFSSGTSARQGSAEAALFSDENLRRRTHDYDDHLSLMLGPFPELLTALVVEEPSRLQATEIDE